MSSIVNLNNKRSFRSIESFSSPNKEQTDLNSRVDSCGQSKFRRLVEESVDLPSSDSREAPLLQEPTNESRNTITSAMESESSEPDDGGHAMLELGKLYEYGVPRSRKKAFECYYEAAELGNVEALVRVAYCHKYGQGTAYDREEAFDCFYEAAELGNPIAMRNLGDFYQYGWGGMLPDLQSAIYWYRTAADLGDTEAMRSLGDYHQNRNRTPRDLETAFVLYKEAAEQGNINAMSRLARCYRYGIGIAKNYDMEIQWCNKMFRGIMKRRDFIQQ